jgi:cytochrome c oxidase subunit 4
VSEEHKPNRKEYLVIFVALTLLTVLEVGVVYVPVARGLLISALVLLALGKAALVALFYMHLKHETKILKGYVVLPFIALGIYALILIFEGAWRGGA